MDPTTEEKRSGIGRLVSLFSNTQLGEEPNQWINLARSLAVQLRSPSLDWRDLARVRASPQQCPQFFSVRHA
jgi:hypothetical protein